MVPISITIRLLLLIDPSKRQVSLIHPPSNRATTNVTLRGRAELSAGIIYLGPLRVNCYLIMRNPERIDIHSWTD